MNEPIHEWVKRVSYPEPERVFFVAPPEDRPVWPLPPKAPPKPPARKKRIKRKPMFVGRVADPHRDRRLGKLYQYKPKASESRNRCVDERRALLGVLANRGCWVDVGTLVLRGAVSRDRVFKRMNTLIEAGHAEQRRDSDDKWAKVFFRITAAGVAAARLYDVATTTGISDDVEEAPDTTSPEYRKEAEIAALRYLQQVATVHGADHNDELTTTRRVAAVAGVPVAAAFLALTNFERRGLVTKRFRRAEAAWRVTDEGIALVHRESVDAS